MPIINRSTLYAQQMSSVDNGLALWDPQPGWVQDSDGMLTKPCPHIRPGDVGYVEQDGGFVRLFNIHLPEDHSDQGMGPFPEYFEPVKQDMGCLQLKTVAPIVYRSHRRLNMFGSMKTVAPLPVNGSAHLSFERNTGALLGFFDSGLREDSRMNRTYMEQMVKCRSSWLQAAQSQDSTRCLEDLLLVTGCTRVRSWVMGVIENERIDGKLMLSVDFTPDASVGLQVSSGISYENVGSSSLKYGPPERLKHHEGKDKRKSGIFSHPSPSSLKSSEKSFSNAIKGWSDQCIFIRGFRMKQRRFGGNAVPKKLKAAAEPRDPRKDKEPDQDILLVGPSPDEDEDEGDEGEEAGDHMKAALDYILENSDADFALIHEDDILAAYVSAYLKFESTTKQGEWENVDWSGFNLDQVLQDCHPEVIVKEYSGVKVGSLSEQNDDLQTQFQEPTLASAEKQEAPLEEHSQSSASIPPKSGDARRSRRLSPPSRYVPIPHQEAFFVSPEDFPNYGDEFQSNHGSDTFTSSTPAMYETLPTTSSYGSSPDAWSDSTPPESRDVGRLSPLGGFPTAPQGAFFAGVHDLIYGGRFQNASPSTTYEPPLAGYRDYAVLTTDYNVPSRGSYEGSDALTSSTPVTYDSRLPNPSDAVQHGTKRPDTSAELSISVKDHGNERAKAEPGAFSDVDNGHEIVELGLEPNLVRKD